MAQWISAYCMSGAEFTARDKLREKGIEVLCLFERTTKRKAIPGRPGHHKTITIETPLFASYIFAKTDAFYEAEKTQGVISLVKIQGTPIIIKDRVIDKLKSLADDSGLVSSVDITKPSYWFKGNVGDQMVFGENSALNGLVGTIASIARIDIAAEITCVIDILGSQREIDIPLHQAGVIRHRA